MMRWCVAFSITAAILAANSRALAQGQPIPQAPTTVQLPTFSFFTVQTTVSVPDGGGMSLGGLGRAGNSSTTRGFGPWKNRGLAGASGASGMSIHARVMDHQEMDEAILAQAAAQRSSAAVNDASRIQSVARPASGAAPESVAAIRQQNAVRAAATKDEAAEYFAKAQRAEAEGKPGVARIYYQMVIRRDAGQLKTHAQSRLAAIESGARASVANR